MKTILEHSDAFLFESVQNFFTNDTKMKYKYADQVWAILSNAYHSQGGLVGNGFQNIDAMVTKIPFWKLDIVDGEVLSVIMYKFKDDDGLGYVRKLVAIGALYDEKRVALIRKKLLNIMKMEFSRSMMEVSGLAEAYFLRNFPDAFKKSLVESEKVILLLPDDEIRPIANDKYRYERKIGGEWHEKVMCGNTKDRSATHR